MWLKFRHQRSFWGDANRDQSSELRPKFASKTCCWTKIGQMTILDQGVWHFREWVEFGTWPEDSDAFEVAFNRIVCARHCWKVERLAILYFHAQAKFEHLERESLFEIEDCDDDGHLQLYRRWRRKHPGRHRSRHLSQQLLLQGTSRRPILRRRPIRLLPDIDYVAKSIKTDFKNSYSNKYSYSSLTFEARAYWSTFPFLDVSAGFN